MTAEELMVQEEIESNPSNFNRWKWFSMVDKLACSDITKYDEVYEINYIQALNYLSYHKELDDYKRAAAKNNKH